MQCARCQCTDESPCEGGCSWVEPDLCSSCVPTIRQLLECADAEMEMAQRARNLDDSASAERHVIASAVFRIGAAIAARAGLQLPGVLIDTGDLGDLADGVSPGLVLPR